jgi:hypothetical protein
MAFASRFFCGHAQRVFRCLSFALSCAGAAVAQTSPDVASSTAPASPDLSAPPAGFQAPAAVPSAAAAVPPSGMLAPGSVATQESEASTQTPPGPRLADGVSLGLRLGYANPSGSAWKGASQESLTEGVVSLQADLNYRLAPLLAGGFYGALGLGSNGDRVDANCKAGGVSCTVFTLDIGVQGELQLLPSSAVDPWLAVAAGIDLLSQNVDYGGYSESVNLYGPALGVSAGVDLDLGAFLIGPYVGYQLGWYTSLDVSSASYSSDDAELRDKAMHRWVTIGVRGSYGFGS